MNILSLFDGISCAKLALDNIGIKYDNYFASEIDPHAIKVSQSQHDNIRYLGDIRSINYKKLGKIDLLVGGSPCQDLSHAQAGEGIKGSKSSLFYEYINAFKALKPKYFLLENVDNKWSELMSEYIGVNYVKVNSNLFSAQSRPRLYWTNIDFSDFPKNISSLTLSDVIETKVDDKYFYNKIDYNKLKSICDFSEKISSEGIQKVFDLPIQLHRDKERQRRVYSLKSKSPTLLARADTTKIFIKNRIRKLTPKECERLQCLPDNYTLDASDTQRYKMIGNGFTVSVIEHIFKSLSKEPTQKRNLNLLPI